MKEPRAEDKRRQENARMLKAFELLPDEQRRIWLGCVEADALSQPAKRLRRGAGRLRLVDAV